MRRFIIITGIVLGICFPISVLGATVSIRGTELLAPQGEGVFEVVLDTEGAEVNAIEGVLAAEGGTVRVEGVEDGGSFISFWLVPPTPTDTEVRFSGVVPGGLEGSELVLFRVIAEGVRVGTGTVALAATALLNDGFGTALPLAGAAHAVTVSDVVPRSVYEAHDTIPPEPFTVVAARSPAPDAGWIVAFAARDGETGVAYYEVQERLWGSVDETAWERAENPYVLRGTFRMHHVFVKAVDRAGNSTVAHLPPPLPGRILAALSVLMVVLALVLLGAAVRRWRSSRISLLL